MVEVEEETGDTHWTGLMSVYVDDLLFTSEEGAMDSAVSAIEKVWAIAEVEKTGEGRVVKYCGFEIENALDDQGENNGFVVSQKKYEKEMVQRFGIEKSIDFPNIRLTEEDEIQQENIDANDVKMAQSMAGALLWLSTRTRPDLAMTVSAACRLCTKIQGGQLRSQPPSCSMSRGCPVVCTTPRMCLRISGAHGDSSRWRGIKVCLKCMPTSPMALGPRTAVFKELLSTWVVA